MMVPRVDPNINGQTLLEGREGLPCPYCAAPMRGRLHKPTRDHAIPRALGGTLAFWNRIICCWSCNNEKGDMTLEEYWSLCEEEGREAMAGRIGRLIRVLYGSQAYRQCGTGKRTPGTRAARLSVWRRLALEPPAADVSRETIAEPTP